MHIFNSERINTHSPAHVKIHMQGPARWRKWLKVLTLHARDPIWAPVLIPAAPLPFQLPACGLGKQSRTAQKLWEPAPAWETRKRLLASDRHSIGPLRSLGEWIIGRKIFLSVSPLSVYPPFQWKNNKNKSLKKKSPGWTDNTVNHLVNDECE